MQIYNRFNSQEFVEQINYLRFRWTPPQLDDMKDFITSDEYSEDNRIIGSVMYFFEGIGVLVSKGLIDVELVDDLMSGPLTQIWERMLPHTRSLREIVGPQAGEWYEHLYDKVKPMRDINKQT
jgi:hypothetical protein